MSRIVFLLEERSMKEFLTALMPRVLPGTPFLCVPHEGKQDLEKSIPRKLRGWREPGASFVVVRDNDGGDCRALKKRLARLCQEAGRPETVVRIACQELEAWYLADPEALAQAFGDEKLRHISKRERFRDPDAVVNPSRALAEIVPAFQKMSGARLMGSHVDPIRSTSQSFRAFLDAAERCAASLLAPGRGARES